jgi:hypothetical protein
VDESEALAIAAALEAGDVHVIRSTGAPEVTVERLTPPAPTDEGGDG